MSYVHTSSGFMEDDELVLGCRGSSGAGGVAFVTSVGLM